MILINLVSYVNPKNLVYITADHLKTLKSPNEQTGTYSHLELGDRSIRRHSIRRIQFVADQFVA